jgi:hypothetical protein
MCVESPKAVLELASSNEPPEESSERHLCLMIGSAAFGKNVGYTYKRFAPLLYEDHVRAERAAKSK